MTLRCLWLLLPLLLLLACGQAKGLKETMAPAAPAPAVAPEAPTPSAAPEAPTPTPIPTLTPTPAPAPKALRVHVIGASVSGGFADGPLAGASERQESVTLQQLLQAWAGDDARVSTHNPKRMWAMFTDPEKIGSEQLAGVQRAKPDVLVAIDFPFWFAYGHVQGDEADARRAGLAAGLALLDKLEMTVLLGDLPDMRGAAVRMLRPKQIPEPGLLRQLNEQLAAFVAAHPNMHLLPLAATVRTMRDEGVVLPLASGAVKTPPGALQQEDRLHATRLGMAFLGHSIQEDLRRSCPDGHPLRARQWTFEQFVAAAGAEDELEAVVAAAKAKSK